MTNFFSRINEIRNKIWFREWEKEKKTMANCFGIKLNIKYCTHTHTCTIIWVTDWKKINKSQLRKKNTHILRRLLATFFFSSFFSRTNYLFVAKWEINANTTKQFGFNLEIEVESTIASLIDWLNFKMEFRHALHTPMLFDQNKTETTRKNVHGFSRIWQQRYTDREIEKITTTTTEINDVWQNQMCSERNTHNNTNSNKKILCHKN